MYTMTLLRSKAWKYAANEARPLPSRDRQRLLFVPKRRDRQGVPMGQRPTNSDEKTPAFGRADRRIRARPPGRAVLPWGRRFRLPFK
jgi:hypothetical protein